jgi:hypothetical protein
MPTLEASLMTGVRIIKAMLTLDLSSQIDRVRIDNALQSRRQIFFFPSELRKVLEELSEGRAVDPEVAAYFAEEVENIPLTIGDALRFLEIGRFEDRNALLIEDLETMESIRARKIDLRLEIHRFFRRYRTEGPSRSRVEASRILGQIELFNAAVKELEAKLRSVRGLSRSTTGGRTRRTPSRDRPGA